MGLFGRGPVEQYFGIVMNQPLCAIICVYFGMDGLDRLGLLLSSDMPHFGLSKAYRLFSLDDGSGRQLRNAWKEHLLNVPKNPVINLKERLPGYG